MFKRILLTLLTLAILTTTAATPVMAADPVIHTHMTFDTGIKTILSYPTNITTVAPGSSTGTKIFTGEQYDVIATSSSNKGGGYTQAFWGTDATNFSSSISGSGGKTGSLYTKLFLNNKDTGTAEPVTGDETNLVYLETRLKCSQFQGRADQIVTLMDSSGRNIAQVGLLNPIIIQGANAAADIQSDAAYVPTATPSEWFYIRFAIDFVNKKYKVYVGPSLAEMQAFTTTMEADGGFNFRDAAADNLHGYQHGSKLNILMDDFKIYTSSTGPLAIPVAKNVKVTGNPNLGSTFEATYEFVDPSGKSELNSICYWEAASTPEFIDAVKIKQDTATSAGTTADATRSLLLDSTASGKYIRFVIIPGNQDGVKGDPVRINASVYINGTNGTINMVDGIFLRSMGIQGTTALHNRSDIQNILTTAPWGGNAVFVNTTTSVQTYSLVYAVYKDGQLIAANIKNGTIASAIGAAGGIRATSAISTDTANRFTAEPDFLADCTLRVFAFNGISDLKPLQLPTYNASLYTTIGQVVGYGSHDLATENMLSWGN